MTEQPTFDLIVIGAGPAGYVAAIRAAQLGMKVACVEREKTLGGTCLNVGCIPSKALLESSELYHQAREKLKDHGIVVQNLSLDFQKFMERKTKVVQQLTGGIAFLFKKNKIAHVVGTAKLQPDKSVAVANGSGETRLKAHLILIATGSASSPLPGIEIDNRLIVDSTGALSLSKIPKKMVVIGGGYIGLELGSVYLRLGSEVTVVEALDRILAGMDRDLGRGLQRILEREGMKIHLSTKVKKVVRQKEGAEVVFEEAGGKEASIITDLVLVAVGRRPLTEGLGLKEAGVETDEKGRIKIDENYQTSREGIYAVGDVIAGPMLAHKAMEEGAAVAEILAGQTGRVNYRTVPSVIYTWPEIASVGMTEEEAKEKGVAYKVFKFPFLANGRALALGEKDGFVKLIAEKEGKLLGAHILGPRASDLIAEMVLALERGATAEEIGRMIHAHPTLAEAIKEAALGLGDGPIHA
jgi:dihydrolipoamide dehydrogenase